ncbi:unnamed protein product [Adineta steineri]|uniref:Uncharacterized protein n=1 Tax=Adineta steineri TaxID=433720 RepID=A0A813UGZ0_9BILA|nr:unnamed protein product [Adineta steineri]CAF0827550.1 unnamed protein product [Adineta steineri]
MFASSLITDENHLDDYIKSLDNYPTRELKTNNQKTSSLTSRVSHNNPSFISEFDPWGHQSVTHVGEDTSLQSSSQVAQVDPISHLHSSSKMSRDNLERLYKNSNLSSGTDLQFHPVLSGKLAAPSGWRNESVPSSLSPLSDDTDSYRNCSEKHEHYKTLNTCDGPPMIFSSTDEINEVINEKPSSKHLRSISFNDYNDTSIENNPCQERKTVLTEEQRTAINSIDNCKIPPVVVHKKLANNIVKYNQRITVRYLQPPTPPPPGPIIIREIRQCPLPPQSPITIRQRPRPPCTPPPLIFREPPPPRPPRPPSKIIEKLLPPPPRPPRQVIVEKLGAYPPKPSDVLVERWLPYKRNDQRRILYERAPAPYLPPREPNLLIMHDQRNARINKEFINQGVVRADPQHYLQLYGAEINTPHNYGQYAYLVDEATRSLPPPQPLPPTGIHYNPHNSYPNLNQHPPPAPLISSMWDRMRSAASPFNSPPYHQNSPTYGYSPQYPRNDHLNSYHPPNNYAAHMGDHRIMPNVPSPWSHNSHSPPPPPSHLPSYNFNPISHSPNTIRVTSDHELHNVLSNLTNGRVPTPLRSF